MKNPADRLKATDPFWWKFGAAVVVIVLAAWAVNKSGRTTIVYPAAAATAEAPALSQQLPDPFAPLPYALSTGVQQWIPSDPAGPGGFEATSLYYLFGQYTSLPSGVDPCSVHATIQTVEGDEARTIELRVEPFANAVQLFDCEPVVAAAPPQGGLPTAAPTTTAPLPVLPSTSAPG